jgi:hypothetical protein
VMSLIPFVVDSSHGSGDRYRKNRAQSRSS